MTPCSVVVGYQRFGGLYCLHLQGEEDGDSCVFWVVTQCSIGVGYQRFSVHAASIFRVKEMKSATSLGCDAVQCCKIPTLRGTVLPPSSG